MSSACPEHMHMKREEIKEQIRSEFAELDEAEQLEILQRLLAIISADMQNE